MSRRGISLSLVVVVCTAASARPEAVAIDHQAVGCIVIGKYPKMNACFSPAADLARSRVYFRPEGVASWYYVDMKTDQPCFAGTLPRPGKKLVGKKIEYYVEAQNKTFEPARTAEFAPIVVNSAQECKKNVPVAPFLNNATVAVFPSVPAGFVGASAIGTAAVVGIVGAGAAAATTAVVVASNNNDTTTTTLAVGVTPTSTTTTVPAPATTTTTTLPSTNHAPFAVLNVSPDPPSGQGPLTVTFDLCKSTDADKDGLSFFFDFGDGAKATGSCLESHTYSATFRSTSNVRALDKSYGAEACVVDPGNLSACRSRNVNVTSPPPPTTTPACPAPTITITSPSSPSEAETCFPPEPVTVTAETSMDTTAVQFCASAIDPSECPSPGFRSANVRSGALPPCGSASGSEGEFTGTVDLADFGCYQIVGTATNGCGGTATSPRVIVELTVSCFRSQTSKGSALAWSSDLRLEGGRLQVVVNGTVSSYPERGRTLARARLKDGENRVEATVVESGGKAGRWTMDLSASEAIQAGTIRVLAGEIESIGVTAVTFKLRGTPGERIVFTFQKK